MHGQQARDMINKNLDKVDSRALTNLNEDGYQAFLNGMSKNLNLQTMQEMRNNQDRAPSTEGSPNKRHLPVAAKQMVYNEWGAVIKHQDEMDQALRKAEKERHKETQQKYKLDLEEQKEDQKRKILEN